MEPLVSIIIPAYNVEQYIDACIESCVSQTYTNIEIMIIDDGSTDLTPEKLDDWEKQDDRIRVFYKQNDGMSQARNMGIQYASGELIIFLDSDDVLSTSAVSKLVQGWDGCYTTIVGGGYIRFHDNEIPQEIRDCEFEMLSKEEFLHKRNGYYCWGILFPQELIKETGIAFDESMRNLEDVVWLSIVFLYVKAVVYYDEQLYQYRINPNSITGNSQNITWQVGCWIYAFQSIKKASRSRKLSVNQRMEVWKRLRMCRNNIYAELIEANYGLKEYAEIYSEKCCKHLPLKNRLEYRLYWFLLKIKSYLRY